DVKAFNKGMLIPRTSTTSRTAIPNTKGLLVYDTTTNSFWYNNGTAWDNLANSNSVWSLNGNSGTDTSVNFIGTTDAHPLKIKVNNTIAGLIDYNTTGNTSLGYETFFLNTTGHLNTAIGFQSLTSNTIGAANAANGFQTLWSNTSGNFNTASGSQALLSNITGSYNTATGSSALSNCSTGSDNTANGFIALSTNTTGSFNVAMGSGALQSNSTASANTALGYSAMSTNTTGANNTSAGHNSLYSNTTGNYNSALGDNAGYYNSTGSYNVFLGQGSGSGVFTGSNNVCIGRLSGVSNDVSNSVAIGYSAYASQSNSVVLGSSSQRVGIGTTAPYSSSQLTVNGGTNYYSIWAENHNPSGGVAINGTTDQGGGWGIYGSSTGSTSTQANIGLYGYAAGSTQGTSNSNYNYFLMANYGVWGAAGNGVTTGLAGGFNGDITVFGNVYQTSDAKLKTNIQPIGNALNGINKLLVKQYDYSQDVATESKLSLPRTHQFGFLAQDVQTVFPNLVSSITAPKIDYEAGGNKPKVMGSSNFLAVNYIGFIPLLTEAVQELSIENDALKKQLADLAARVNALEKK
ncbi:MAG: tail fiber domain-containing protein, partial [Bacteroidetes bacterium]|nr:tail fiber domain-containing protein [Bacteroidota bacterium]